ncbi:MAG: protein kinase domain-containing protein [Candidatus Acidiferrales bacterium]
MIGRTIAHYDIEAELGRGGMGVVYLARDTMLGREVALKVLPEALANDRTALERLRNEAKAASALNHPHICTIHEMGEAGGIRFIAMERVDGRPLRELIPTDGMPVDTLVRYAVQVAAGLAHAHEKGVVHRDLKSSNIVVTREGHVKILDFGLAVHRASESDDATRSLDAPVGPSGLSGTLPYLAPEILAGQEADAHSDLWALGVVLYEMATGVLPFRGRTGFETTSAVLREPPPPLPQKIPAGLRAIILRCLVKEPAQRYQSVREVRAALEAVSLDIVNATAIPGTAKPAKITRLRRVAITLGAAVVALAALAAVTRSYWGGWFGAQTQIRSLAVLPMKSLGQETGSDNYLGIGIADTIITKVSQISDLNVRPSSAVRRYATLEVEALEAARQLRVDSVLDGTVQRSGDQIRINVNLLRTSDGASLWSATLNESFTDIFAVQDQIAQRVAEGLRGRLTAAEQARLTKRHTSNPEAYEYFLRGEEHFDKRSTTGKTEIEAAIRMYQRAIELDPNYALAHAQLGYALTWMALFSEPDEPAWRTRAETALQRAEALDASLAETHVVRHELFWSIYGGFNIEAAIRELRRAQQLNPNLARHQLGVMYAHLGLEQAAARELARSLADDPTSESKQSWYVEAFDLVGNPDGAIAAFVKLENPEGAGTFMRKSFMWKQQFEKAEELIRRDLARNQDDPFAKSNLALLTALRGNFARAEAEMPALIQASRRSRAFHHMAYNMASIYALQGKAEVAVQWLRSTVEAGMPNYTLFSRDPHLDPIRQHPAFGAFMNELKPRWDAYRREFDH